MGLTDFVTNPIGAVLDKVPGGSVVKATLPNGGSMVPKIGWDSLNPLNAGETLGIPAIMDPMKYFNAARNAFGSSTKKSDAAPPAAQKQEVSTRRQGIVATAPAGATTRRSAALQSLGDMRQNAADFRENQASVSRTGRALSNLEAAAAGRAPSVAELSARRQLAETQQSQLGMAARARGAGGALAMRNAMANAQRMGSENVMNSQIARAQEMAAARGQFAEGAQAERNAATDTALRQLQARQLAAQQYSQQAEGSFKNTMDTELTRAKIEADRDAALRKDMIYTYSAPAQITAAKFNADSSQREGAAPAIQGIANTAATYYGSKSGLTAEEGSESAPPSRQRVQSSATATQTAPLQSESGYARDATPELSTRRQGLAASKSNAEYYAPEPSSGSQRQDGGWTRPSNFQRGNPYYDQAAEDRRQRDLDAAEQWEERDKEQEGWTDWVSDKLWGPKISSAQFDLEYAQQTALRDAMAREYAYRGQVQLPQEELERPSAPPPSQASAARPAQQQVSAPRPPLDRRGPLAYEVTTYPDESSVGKQWSSPPSAVQSTATEPPMPVDGRAPSPYSRYTDTRWY